jgi:DNA-binding CsgD family transcriptional regulator
MGVPNPTLELVNRLRLKLLDSQFRAEVSQGLNCSPFEAECVLQVVKEVFFPFVDEAAAKAPPGKITLVAVAADEPAGKPLSECRKVAVCLSVHRGESDDRLLIQQGATAFRRARIAALCDEALSQDGLLTREDLAYRIFFVSPRTISRDLNWLRAHDRTVILRSTRHDIGPVLTHRTQIVRLALEGKTTSEICRILRHSPEAVANYLATFVRCVQLQAQQLEVGQIAFLLRRGPSLVRQYLELFDACRGDKNRAYHLDKLLNLGPQRRGKKSVPGGRRHG